MVKTMSQRIFSVLLKFAGVVNTSSKLGKTWILLVVLNRVSCYWISLVQMVEADFLARLLRISYYCFSVMNIPGLLMWCVSKRSKLMMLQLPSQIWVSRYLIVQFTTVIILSEGTVRLAWFRLFNGTLKHMVKVFINLTSFAVFHNLQIIATATAVGSMMENASREIDKLIDVGGSSQRLCREASRICETVTRDVCWVLRAVYIEYALRIMTEIPLSGAEVMCRVDLYNTLNMSFGLMNMLFVVCCEDKFQQSISRLRKRLRTASSLERKQREVQTFLQSNHGIRLNATLIVSGWTTSESPVTLVSWYCSGLRRAMKNVRLTTMRIAGSLILGTAQSVLLIDIFKHCVHRLEF